MRCAPGAQGRVGRVVGFSATHRQEKGTAILGESGIPAGPVQAGRGEGVRVPRNPASDGLDPGSTQRAHDRNSADPQAQEAVHHGKICARPGTGACASPGSFRRVPQK